MDTPLVSVIVPCFNAEAFIEKALESVLKQSYKNIEVICINDGSLDQTEIKLSQISAFDNRVKLITQKNLGVVEARRVGLEYAVGDYIALVDADDYIENNAIEEAVNLIVNHDIDCVVWELYSTDGVSEQELISYEKNKTIISGDEAFLRTLGKWKITGLGVFLKENYTQAYTKYDSIGLESFNSDEYISRVALLISKRVGLIKSKYFYFENPLSATRHFKLSWLGRVETCKALITLLEERCDYSLSKNNMIDEVVSNIILLNRAWLVNKENISADNHTLYINSCIGLVDYYNLMDYFQWLLISNTSLKKKFYFLYVYLGFKLRFK